ncbi:MAG: serine hydrolase [Chloroflexi bacterium]|nr:serine hydrolase [Chloroflexota bacterium]
MRARLFLPLRSWRLQLVGAAVGILVAILSAQSLASAREGATTYQVQPGDTLSTIAIITGIPVDKLVSLNSIQNPNMIIAGQTLSVTPGATPQPSTSAAAPSATPAASSATASTQQYTVKPGDTLWAISQANGVSVNDLLQVNTLANADQLSVGQVLQLPVTAAPIQRSATVGSSKPASGTPTATQTGALLQKVISQAQKVGGTNVHLGVAATNLTTGERIAWHADDEFPSASVMKLPILVELERQVATGQLSWTDSLRSEASAMIAVSDNNAANEIADAIRPQSVNDSMTKVGLTGTHFYNLFDDPSAPLNPGQNQTTAANMARLLELVSNNQIVNPQVSGDIRSLLAQNTDRSKLVRLLPADAQVAHKSGWFDGVANDVGIVTVSRKPATWVVAVFTQNIPDAETGNQMIAAVSKTLYDAWAS